MTQKARGLSLFALTMIAIGSTIGSGIFKTPKDIAEAVPDPLWMTLLWILGGLVSMIGALVFAELGGRFPRGGGVYTYLHEAFGPLPAFLYGWCLLTVVSSGTIAALIVVFADYARVFLGFGETLVPVFAAFSIVVLTLFNTFGLKSSEWFANVSTVLKIIGIYGLLILLLFLGKRSVFEGSIPVSAILSDPKAEGFDWAKAFVGVLWSYTGWHYASFVTGDALNPKRNVPIAMVAGTLIVTLSYVLCNIGYLSVLSIDEMRASGTLAADATGRIFSGGDIAVSVLIAVSVFGCAGIYVLATPRIIKQMSNEGLFFKTFGKDHPRFGVPVNAILLQSAWAIVLVFYWGKFESLYTYVTITEWFFLLLACAGLFLVRQKAKNSSSEVPFKSPLYPLLPLLFIAVVAWFILKNVVSKDPAAYFGLLVIPIGIVLYFVFRNTGNSQKQ